MFKTSCSTQRDRRAGYVLWVTAFASVLLMGAPAAAASFTVTRFDDPPPDGCAPADCSLREAIIAANTAAGSTVTLPAGTYTLTRGGNDNASANAAIGDLDIFVGTTLTGAGASNTIVQAGLASGGGIHRVFDIHSAGEVRISRMTIRNGRDVEAGSGGCIRNGGVATISSVIVSDCYSPASGGGIASYHTLTLVGSTIRSNLVHSTTSAPAVAGGVAGGPGTALGTGSLVTIISSVITNNTASSSGPAPAALGGGFGNTATMQLLDSLVSGNSAIQAGGGISTGTMTIRRSTIHGNTARRDVGGVDNDGTMTIEESTFSNNAAGFNCIGDDCANAYAGGVLNTADGTMYVNNTTISGNSCLVSGGGILNAAGTLTVSSATIVGNTCRLGAGLTASDTTYLKNSIVAGNTATDSDGGDMSGLITSQGYNLLGTSTGSLVTGNTTGNISGVDPGVGPLQNNGGPTATRALSPHSVAFNRGNPDGCTNHLGTPLATDQRGYRRISQGRCDIGAFELHPSGVLWTSDNLAMIWHLNGSSYVGMIGFSGPGAGWRATSYWRNPDESLELLWTSDGVAMVWSITANNGWGGAIGLGGPGPGWIATSYFRHPDGSWQLLWTTDNQLQVWTINAGDTWGGATALAGPGPGWNATSYYRAADGSHRVLWTTDTQAQVWTLTPSWQLAGIFYLGAPAPGWTATSYHLNGDGSWHIVWSFNDLTHVWTANADGTFGGAMGLGGVGSSWSVQSYLR
jgi:CSLREA domain-containing protein